MTIAQVAQFIYNTLKSKTSTNGSYYIEMYYQNNPVVIWEGIYLKESTDNNSRLYLYSKTGYSNTGTWIYNIMGKGSSDTGFYSNYYSIGIDRTITLISNSSNNWSHDNIFDIYFKKIR